MPTGDQRGQIKCVTAGTQVRRRANTCTRLLPRSIVPGASVSTSAGLDSRGFLIGQAGPGGHPVTSPLAVRGDAPLPEGGGGARKAWLVLNKGVGASQRHGEAPGAPRTTHTSAPRSSHLFGHPRRVGSHPAAGSSLPPPRGLLCDHLVSRFRRAEAEAPPVYTSTLGLRFFPGSKHSSVLQTGRLAEQRAQLAPPSPTAPILTTLVLSKAARPRHQQLQAQQTRSEFQTSKPDQLGVLTQRLCASVSSSTKQCNNGTDKYKRFRTAPGTQ